MTGVSAHERHIRDELKLTDDDVGGTAPNECVIPIPAGVLRGILADLDMWRGIGTREVELTTAWPGDPVTAADAEYAAEYHGNPDIVRAIIKVLPNDRAQGLRVLDQTRRMVERFKR
jgi:hypothetical protein